MSIGLRRFYKKAADQTVTASTALVDVTDLVAPVAANQKIKVTWWIPFSTGASGGFKLLITTPAALTNFIASLQAVDGTAAVPGSEVAVVQTAAANFANAWAVAGNHYFQIEAFIENGANAGNIGLQMACNSAAGALSALRGAWMDVVVL